MKIAIVGSGGVGGYFGAQLARQGRDVSFVARGKHLQKMQSDGLSVQSPDGNFVVQDFAASDQPEELGKVDCVLVAVKGWQLQVVTTIVKALSRPDTLVLPLLNGVDAPGLLNQHLGSESVLGGLCGIIAHLDGPGVIRHVGIKPYIRFGELNKERTARVESLAETLNVDGIDAQVADDIELAMWHKFIFIAPVSGVTSVSVASIDRVVSTDETRKLLETVLDETMAVGRAAGIELTAADRARTVRQFEATPRGGTTSLQRDIKAGLRSELETQIGAVIRLAGKYAIDIPATEFIYASLLPQELAAQQG